MKQRIILTVLMAGLLVPGLSHGQALSETFREGLFQEEANQDLSAAIEAYQEVLRQFDKKRHIAASALFRLGECYRKQGETKKAGEFYRRVITEFGGQETLVRLAKENLKAIDQPLPESGETSVAATDRQTQEIARIKDMIRESPDLINAVGESGKTPLQEAAAKGQLKVAKFLLANGAKVNQSNRGGETALHYAAENGHKAIADLLLEKGADINATDKNGRPPLDYAVQRRYRILTKMLLKRGANPNIRFDDRTSSLHTAADMEASSIVALLLKHGSNVNIEDESGRPPLFYAVRHAHPEIIEELLKNGANVNHRDDEGRTVLHEATQNIGLAIVKFLLNNGADPNIRNQDKKTALHLAVNSYRPDPEIVKALLNHGANPNARTRLGRETPLHLAAIHAEQHGAKITRLLLKHGADPNVKNQDDLTPLHVAIVAAESQCLPIVKALLEGGAQTDMTDERGRTPLIVAVGRGRDTDVIRALLEASADPNRFSPRGTALHEAVLESPKIVKLLIKHGADVDARSSKHGVTATPLLHASRYVTTDAHERGTNAAKNISIVLANGADPNAQNKAGNAALHRLCKQMPDRFGSSSSKRAISVITTLLDHGANPNILNADNHTCFNLEESEILRETLIEHGRRFLILVQREDRQAPIFHKRPDSLNQFTLYEALFEVYRSWHGSNRASRNGSDFFQDFPKLSEIEIHRRSENGNADQTQTINLLKAAKTDDCSGDVSLKWGDIVEIPKTDHKLNARWNGLPSNVANTIENCLKRQITITLPGTSHAIELIADLPSREANRELRPRIIARSSGRSEGNESSRSQAKQSEIKNEGETKDQPDKKRLHYFRFKEVVRQANALRSSSDKSSIRLIRPISGQDEPLKATLDLQRTNHRTDLWLKDGDTLHIPEK